ncbi:MAG: hypothetical protein AB7K09_12385 [Planctomycetota bacterium]
MIPSDYARLKEALHPRPMQLGDLVEMLHPHTPPEPEPPIPLTPAQLTPLQVGHWWSRFIEPYSGTFRFVAVVRLAEMTVEWALRRAPDHDELRGMCDGALTALRAFEAGTGSATDAVLAVGRCKLPDRLPVDRWAWIVPTVSIHQLFHGVLQFTQVAWGMQQWATRSGANVDDAVRNFLARWWRAVRCRLALRVDRSFALGTIDWRAALDDVAKHQSRVHKVMVFARGHGNEETARLLDSPHASVRVVGIEQLYGRLTAAVREKLQQMIEHDRSADVRKWARNRLYGR